MDDQAHDNSLPISSTAASQNMAEMIALLSSCLMLVRPANMGDVAVKEWLAAAAMECGPLQITKLRAACSHARRKATSFAHIVPLIFKFVEDEEAKLPIC